MAVKIKLMRLGKIRQPYYRIVVADARTRRDGRSIEVIGRYHPKEEPSLIEVDSERAQYWLGVGAQPTEPVLQLLKITGDWQKFKGEPGAEGTLKLAEPKKSKQDIFNEILKESGGSLDTGCCGWLALGLACLPSLSASERQLPPMPATTKPGTMARTLWWWKLADLSWRERDS